MKTPLSTDQEGKG